MNKPVATQPNRKSKQFWAESGNCVKLVTGYECPPGDDVWWVPELGYSLTVNYQLFTTENEALLKAIEEAEKFERSIVNKVKSLRAQLANSLTT